MTTLDERMRALRWGREWLQDQMRMQVLDPVRLAQAAEAFQHYPTESDIGQGLRGSVIKREAWLDAMLRTRELLEFAKQAPSVDAELRREASVIERHFPTPLQLPPPGQVADMPWRWVYTFEGLLPGQCDGKPNSECDPGREGGSKGV